MFVRHGSEQLPELPVGWQLLPPESVAVEKELLMEGQLLLTAGTSGDWPHCTELLQLLQLLQLNQVGQLQHC